MALRSLLTAFNDAADKHKDSLADNPDFYMSTVAPQVENATNFLVNQLAAVSAADGTKKKSETTLTWVTILIDSLILVYEASTVGNVAQKCSPLVVMLWWIMGMLVMTKEQGLTVPGAADMLTQQFTSIGYGTATPQTNALKIFHGLHGVVSQMTVNRVMSELYGYSLNNLEKYWGKDKGTPPSMMSAAMSLAALGALTTFIFSFDLGAAGGAGDRKFKLVDGIYQTLITMTTIGYGDNAPSTPFVKTISPFTLPFITGAFQRWSDAAGPDFKESNEEVQKDKKPTEAEFCKCFGATTCPAWLDTLKLPSLPSPSWPKFSAPDISLPSISGPDVTDVLTNIVTSTK